MFNTNWDVILKEEISKSYFKSLNSFIENEYRTKKVFPLHEDIFNAFKCTDYNQVKVVILGQDPYHGDNEAQGLSFSVKQGVKIPPSLRNIFKELYNDLGIKRENTDLSDWSSQGVMLLNSILTVVENSPLSHKNVGWETFTDKVIETLGERREPIIFVLWGSYARSKKNLIKNPNHVILESVHPSPFSANNGFFGSKPFSKINDFLKKNNYGKINW